MADPTSPEELLPSLESDKVPQEPLPVEEPVYEPPASIGVLIGSAFAEGFSRMQKNLEDDKRFREIVEKKVAVWQERHPGLFDDKIFIKRKLDGQIILNPELEKFIPNLRQTSYTEFKILHPDAAAKYEKAEAKRIYYDHKTDPEMQRLQRELDKDLPQRFWAQQGPQKPNEELKKEEKEEKYRQFAKRFPDKAKYYSRFDPDMKKAYQEHAEAKWAGMNRRQRIFTRLYDPDAVPLTQKRTWMPGRIRKVFDDYDARKQAASSRISARYQGSLLARGSARYSRFVDRLFKPIDYLQRTTDRAIDYLANQALRPVNWAKGKATGAARRIAGRIFSAFAKRMPGLAGMLARGALVAKQVIGGILKDGFRGMSRLAGQLLRNGTKFAIQTGARLLGMAVAFTMPAWGWIAAGAGIAGAIILIILIIIMVFQGSNQGEVSVSINKSGPSVTPNPVQGEENLITYTIDVGYSGPVGSVTVVDTLPPETEYVSSTGPVEPTVNGNIITWNIPIQGGTGTTLTGPSNLDTFNQSYFTSIGFPAPNDSVTLSPEGLQRWDAGAGAAILKAAGIVGIDPGLIGAWSFFEGINYDPKVDNCDDGRNGEDTNALTRCSNTSNWQVGGVGIRPSEQLGTLAEAFEQMYGSSDASTVQRVGQEVYSQIGRSGTFPSITAAEAASRFGSNPDLAGDLMRDWQIGAYILAKLFKSYGNSVADTMERWSPSFYDRQKYINWVNALYEAR